MCLEILTQGKSPLLSVKISLFDVFKQLLTLHKLTPTSDATSGRLKDAITKISCGSLYLSNRNDNPTNPETNG